MRFAIIAGMLAVLAAPSRGQVLEMTLIGVVGDSSGFVTPPTDFKEVLDINLNTPINLNPPSYDTGVGIADYRGNGESDSVTVTIGGTTFTQPLFDLVLESGFDAGEGLGIRYGYSIDSFTYFPGTSIQEVLAEITLSANNPIASAPSSLNLIQALPLSDFQDGGFTNFDFFTFDQSGDGLVSVASGHIVSFSVQQVPEPSTSFLLLGGVGLLAFCRARVRRA